MIWAKITYKYSYSLKVLKITKSIIIIMMMHPNILRFSISSKLSKMGLSNKFMLFQNLKNVEKNFSKAIFMKKSYQERIFCAWIYQD